MHRHRHPDALHGVLANPQRMGIAKKNDDGIANEFVECCAVVGSNLRHLREIAVQQKRHFFRLPLRRRFGEVLDIGKEHRQFFALRLDGRLARDNATAPEPVQDLVAVHVGHHDVQQNDVGPLVRARHLQAGLAGRGGHDLITFRQQGLEEEAGIVGVFNHQHARPPESAATDCPLHHIASSARIAAITAA